MSFNIHQLDKIEFDGSEEAEAELEKYQDFIVEEFINSEEGTALSKDIPDIGFWINQFIYYGYGYIGITLPNMSASDVEEIITDLFPRKISLQSPDDANEVIPELKAFWKFLKHRYKLENSNLILSYLLDIDNNYKNIMNDSSRFGMAKSFMTLGNESGFDMTDINDTNKFITSYNQNILASASTNNRGNIGDSEQRIVTTSLSKKAQLKKKKMRKLKKASRKKNKKRK